MIKEILQRLSSDTPKFFKTLRKIALTTSALSGAILLADLTIPDSIGDLITKAGVLSGIIVAFTASLPTIWGTDENGEVISK